jgi:[ribosomal protein S5]-alanine N-acetyltransferase
MSRVTISRFSGSDEADFLAAVRASRHLHRPWVAPADSAERVHAMVERLQGPASAGFVLRRRDTAALTGVVEVTNIVRGGFRSAYLGYYAFAGHERQGLMREGLELVVRAAFTQLKLHRLEANIQPANAASIALVKSCGFALEGYSPRYLKIGGRWRDHERWARLAD